LSIDGAGDAKGVVRTITRQIKCVTTKSVFDFSVLLISIWAPHSGFFLFIFDVIFHSFRNLLFFFILILEQRAPRGVLSHSDKEREKKIKQSLTCIWAEFLQQAPRLPLIGFPNSRCHSIKCVRSELSLITDLLQLVFCGIVRLSVSTLVWIRFPIHPLVIFLLTHGFSGGASWHKSSLIDFPPSRNLIMFKGLLNSAQILSTSVGLRVLSTC